MSPPPKKKIVPSTISGVPRHCVCAPHTVYLLLLLYTTLLLLDLLYTVGGAEYTVRGAEYTVGGAEYTVGGAEYTVGEAEYI